MVTTPKLTYQDYVNMEGRRALRANRRGIGIGRIAERRTTRQSVCDNRISQMYSFIEENNLGTVFPRTVRRVTVH